MSEKARPLWKRVLRRPVLTFLRAAEMGGALVYASAPFQSLRALRNSGTHTPQGVAAAVLAHVYYPDVWPEILAVRDALPAGSPLIVTAPSRQAAEVRARAASDPLVEVIERPNRGRDIAPFLHALESGALDRFDAVLKIHTKKSPHLRQGDLRRRALYAALAGSRGAVTRVLTQFVDSRVGLVGPGFYFRRQPVYWMDNRDTVEALCARMGAAPTLGFFEGSMFWLRPAALAPLRALALDVQDFEAEAGQLDGALHHAVERIFVNAASLAGYETRTLSGACLAQARLRSL